uniref:ABC transporter domain-containing protein n=1 Tax=Glossina brevipalpis TaxID=37001 RepID=A0A1A9W0H5_9MUSC
METRDISCGYSYDSCNSQSGSSLAYSNDVMATGNILVEQSDILNNSSNILKSLLNWPPVNLEFHNLIYEVPDVDKGKKRILQNVNGEFKSGELTAIMGPSGAGKTTLLNILAGFGAKHSSGEILVNENPRDMKTFRKMSRYIMQNDMIDPHFTVLESMMLSAGLKLGTTIPQEQKMQIINEILTMLRLQKAANTKGLRLSGGERKRLSIAMELVNNPPIIFLDEPTTGLDDTSSSQCIALLRRIAHAGRTVICSIHTPPAKLFEMFDKVYIMAEGECIYQGSVSNIVPYLAYVGLTCPLTYNPADFIIEAACREYGDYHSSMVNTIENGKIYRWLPKSEENLNSTKPTKSETTSGVSSFDEIEKYKMEIDKELLQRQSTWWQQYRLLLMRMLTRMWRDKFNFRMKFLVKLIIALLVGAAYTDVGNDATKALFNIGFAFTIIIAYLYVPMMPVLLEFPAEVRLLKREYFNQWYRLSSYFVALITSKLPSMLLMGLMYISIVYLMSNQPLELYRFAMLYLVAILTGQTSESLGLLLSSRLNLVNAMFIGPVTAVPLILLSTYGMGYGKDTYISPFMRFVMNCSYMRHSMEAIVEALYGYNRSDSICPPTEIFCVFKNAKFLRAVLGFENLNYTFSIACLSLFYIIFTALAFALIKHRLSTSGSTHPIIQRFNKYLIKYFNFSTFK